MDYEKLMKEAMKFIHTQMKSYDDLANKARSSGDEIAASMYRIEYLAIRDIKVGIDKLALDMKNGK